MGEHGRVDVLVNNVGDYRPLVRFHESTPESWQTMYSTNLEHVFRVTRAFLGPMVEGGGGSIVNVHSVEGMRGFPGEPVYAAMKAAVAHFTTSLAAGYGRKGIRVNGIGPDLTRIGQIRSGLDLLEALVYPSLSIVRSYEPVEVITKTGKIQSGILREENGGKITVITGPTTSATLSRTDIIELRPGKTSIMPAGLDKQISRQELADLLAFLKATRWK